MAMAPKSTMPCPQQGFVGTVGMREVTVSCSVLVVPILGKEGKKTALCFFTVG